MVMQGGGLEHVFADALGQATVRLDPSVLGELTVVGVFPGTRVVGTDVLSPQELVIVELRRYSTEDNPDYTFLDPGTPVRNNATIYCSHCHVRQVEDWVDTPHGTSASNPVVHDVYSGTAAALTAQACEVAGGAMDEARQPGGGVFNTCVLGGGTVADLNPTCEAPCDAPVKTGACADCHAPGIDGELGGRDLLEATGIAYEHGVHCDVCHKVAEVDLSQPAGVAGRLEILRPDVTGAVDADIASQLQFAPLPDVLNLSMGSVYSELHTQARFCAGCHEHEQRALVPGTTLDLERWPSGTLPVHSTYSEWEAGPEEGVAPCQACHMPPDAMAGNSAGINVLPLAIPGRIGGWWRPAGTSRRHVWTGPRSSVTDMLPLAVTLAVDTTLEDGMLVVQTSLRQTGAGHAVPTGEPLRAMVLTVSTTCDGEEVLAVSGQALPATAGYLAVREAGEAWDQWPEAQVGDVLRVVRDEGWLDYAGFGPFGDGRFASQDKGLRDLRVVSTSEVISVDGEGNVSLTVPMGAGDRVFLGRMAGTEVSPIAGAAGMDFARVLTDDAGTLMVPHHRAVDVVRDNRLLPGQTWTMSHSFAAPCEVPEVVARLTYRAYPWWLAEERGWSNPERLVTEVVR
jgi:putative hemolysin